MEPKRATLIAAIVATTLAVTLFDMWTSVELAGSVLFTFPLALCALQRSKRVLWGTAVASAVLTVGAGIWGFDRHEVVEPWTAVVNRSFLVASLLTLTAFIHRWMVRRDGIESAAAEAHRIEQRFRRLLESAPDAMVIADAAGVIQLVNAQAERIFGYTKQEMLGHQVEMLIPMNLRAKHEGHRAGFAGDPKFRMMGHGMELQGRRKDGSGFPVEIALSPLETEGELQVSAAVRDITERKRIADAQQHLLAILRSSRDAIISRDLHGTVTSWNLGAELIFGYKAEEIIGKPVGVLFPPGKHDEEHAIDERVISGGGHVEHYETVRRRKDGSLVEVSLTVSPIRNEKGEITGASKFAHDITERKTKERQVYQMEERFRRLLESAPDAMVIVDAGGIIQLVNAQAESIFGYTKDELLGRPVEMLIPAKLFNRHQKHRTDFAKDPKVRMMGHGLELQGLRKDGSEFPVEIALSPLETEGGLLVSAAIRDITERKLKDKEMNRIEERFRRLLESAPDAMVIVDIRGVIQLVNKQTEQVFGYGREELLGEQMELLIPANLLGNHVQQDAHLGRHPMEHLTGHGLELEGRRKDATEFPIEVTLSPLEVEGGLLVSVAVRDITDRKRAENEIRELNKTLEQRVEERSNELLRSEKRYHDAMDILVEGVQIIGFDWRHLYVNDSLAAQSTFTKEELVGTTMMERYPGIEQSEVFLALEHCMRERVARVMETAFTFPNGTTKTFHLSIQPVNEGLFLLSTDITDSKRDEVKMAAQREQLERQNKELEQFAYIASHDLQEPLRMVTSYVQLLQRRYQDKLDNDANEFIAYAVDGASRMKQLINDLLTFSRLGRAVAVQEVDMNTVLAQVVSNLALAISECGALVQSGDLPTIRASQTEMVQVLQNLIGNAVKFRRQNVRPEVHVSGKAAKDNWQFQVQDNGIGMEEQYAEKVFVPFKRLHDKSKYSGSGIGLAVAQKIVHRYGGRIWFTSVPGQGTTFNFTINTTSS